MTERRVLEPKKGGLVRKEVATDGTKARSKYCLVDQGFGGLMKGTNLWSLILNVSSN